MAARGEYFGIWIVNLLLSLVTLGIYTAWAKVRRLRYFYGNMRRWTATPSTITQGRRVFCSGGSSWWPSSAATTCW
jgi:uncharacterized membrane protein YjgN (DUF898 family)